MNLLDLPEDIRRAVELVVGKFEPWEVYEKEDMERWAESEGWTYDWNNCDI